MSADFWRGEICQGFHAKEMSLTDNTDNTDKRLGHGFNGWTWIYTDKRIGRG
jgi:hypothetical protein